MGSQDIMMASRLYHMRDLKAEIAKLKAENSSLSEKLSTLEAHFDMALLAAEDLRSLKEGEKMLVVDGWNLILGSKREASSREELCQAVQSRIDSGEYKKAWVVFDGPKENVKVSGSLRLSYTGGDGEHRADKFICDYIRMAKYLAIDSRVDVWTNDKDFLKTVDRIKNRI
jgi:hypothetical protein